MEGEKPYVYVIVRSDLSLPQQIVQASHACHHAGAAFGVPEGCHMVLGEVGSREELLVWADRLEMDGVRRHLFWEEDQDLRETALCTEAVQTKGRRLFRRLSLWKAGATADGGVAADLVSR